MSDEVQASPTVDEPVFEPNPRRRFMAVASSVIGGLLTLVPAGIGALFFMAPAVKKRSGESAFIDTKVTLDALPEDGKPQLVTIVTDKVDAWSGFPDQPVGSIWLRRIGDQVIAFNTVCPHLGCAIEHRTAQNDFFCPCHASTFDIDGEKVNSIPPRDMDSLEVKLESGQIFVRFVNYRAGQAEKVPV